MPKIRSAPEDRRGDHPAVRDIIGQIKDRHALLRPAEQAVADAILADVRGAVEASNAEIAARAGVSQPTVTRFCRAIGCEGVRDFKLQLARSLVVGDLYLDEPPPAPAEGNRPAYFDSVFREAHTAIDEVERQIDPGALIKAAGWIERARRVVVFGLGGSSAALAEEMHVRLFRYGIGVNALTDPYMARMTAATLGPNDVLIAISASGTPSAPAQSQSWKGRPTPSPATRSRAAAGSPSSCRWIAAQVKPMVFSGSG